MKTSRRTITFFSFFPVTVLLATPLMFSTLAPASSQNFAAEIDSSDWIVPQSQLVLEEQLEAGDARNGDIGEVKFLQYGRDYIYMAENGETDVNSDAADFRNEPSITDSGEIDTAYVLQNPEFQRQVSDLQGEVEKAGASMPPLLTLVALFAFAMATGSATLKEFFKFSTYTEQVKKTIQVTKKVAKTVYRTITETVARKVKTIKQVAYTAYETNVVQVTPPPSRDKLYELAYFMRVNFVQNLSSFSRPFQRDARYYLPNMSDEREWDDFRAEYDGIASGRKVERTVLKLQEYFSSPAHTNVGRSFNTISDYFFEGIQFTEPALYKKLKKEFDTIVKPVTDPIVNSTGKPYTAYRDEVETKTVYDTISREVPETVYEDVTEDLEITEDVTKYAFTPLNEKIDLAMGYLKNYSRIIQTPSNRNFSDDVLTPNKDLPFFAGAATVYNNLQAELKTANIYNMDRSDPKEVEKLLRRHNEFIYSMKGILEKIQKGQTPEEQMEILFGREYADSMKESENAVAQAEADEKALTARFSEIEELLRTNKISTGYYRSLYSSAKQNRDQLYRRKRDAVKNLKEGKEFYARKFNGTIASLQNLSFLRSLEDWRSTLAYGERSISSRLVPFTTANGSTVYRRTNATTTTTQAQPKQTLGEKFIAYMQLQWTALQPTFAEYKKQYLEWVAENAAKQSKWSIRTAVAFMDGFLDGVWDEIKTIADPSTYAAIAKAIGSIVKTLGRIGWEMMANGTEVLEHIAEELGKVFGTNVEEIKAAVAKTVAALKNITDKASAHDAGKITGMVAFNFIPFAGQVKKGKTVGKILKEVDGAVTDGVKKYKTMVATLMELTEFSKKFTQIKHITLKNISKLIDLSEDARIGKSAGHTKAKHLLASDTDLQLRAIGSYDDAVKSGKKLDEIPPATKFHNEEVMTEAVQVWMKSDVGQEYVGKVVKLSENGTKKLPTSMDFPTVEVGRNIGYGYKTNPNGVTESLTGLTKIKVILHPDGQGGFILKSAFPTN